MSPEPGGTLAVWYDFSMSDSEVSTSAEAPALSVDPSPVEPDYLVVPADDQVAAEIAALLPETAGQIGLVATCLASGITELKDLVEAKAASNTGAASNLMSNIRALRDQDVPPAPSRAVQARSAARSFLRQHESVLSAAARARLEDLITKLSAVVDDTEAQIKEEGDLAAKGDALEEILLKEGGVYVYTYPHYWRHPTVEGTRRTLLKVGMTTKEMKERVRKQAHATNVPEEPLLLRSYRHAARDPRDAERLFHRLLLAADHNSPHKKAGSKEWFQTSVEFLDTIAQTLGMSIDGVDDGTT